MSTSANISFQLLVHVFKETCKVIVKLRSILGEMTELSSEGCIGINYEIGNCGEG